MIQYFEYMDAWSIIELQLLSKGHVCNDHKLGLTRDKNVLHEYYLRFKDDAKRQRP